MVKLFRSIMRQRYLVAPSLLALGLLASTPFALAQSAAPANVQSEAKAPDNIQHNAQAADPRIDQDEVTKRVNQELGVDLKATITGWQRQIDALEKELSRPRLRYSELNEFRDQLQRVRAEVADLWNKLQPRLQADKAQMDLFGPSPSAGQPAEPEQTAIARAELNYHSGLLSSGQTAVNSANLRIENLLNAVQDIRRRNFSSVLFQPIPGIYAYETWANLPNHVPAAIGKIRNLIADWWRGVSDQREVAETAIEALLLALVLGAACWRGIRRIQRWDDGAEPPPFWRRASIAAAAVVFRAVPIVVPVGFLYCMIASEQNLPERIDWLFYFSAQSLVIIFGVWSLTTAVFSPRAAQWRLIALPDAVAARLCRLFTLLAVVYSLTTFLYVATRLAQAPFALTIAIALPSSLLIAGLVVALLRTPLGMASTTASPRLYRFIRTLVWAMVGAIVVCALTGYLPLARFLAQQLVVTGSILALIYLLLLWVDGLAQGFSDDSTMIGRWLKRSAALERTRREQLALPISLFLKFAVLVFSVPLIMLQWGYTGPDIREWYWQLFFGLHIGNSEVTFGALLASILVFGVGYAAARLFQGWLDTRVLLPAGISGGVRNSIRTGIGYLGIVIAALMAFSYAGFSLSNIAIIAGALSVGIGFGLQNLVNNFVSGLILLAERPIRVGDMVVVGGEEGYVRKISVRSTELETFDGAHVLIPNAYFVSEKVKNWTFRNKVRRIAIPIGVAYGSDPRQVQAVLLKVAADNPDVLKKPEPAVTLDEFAAASVNFTLYAFIADISKSGSVRTALAMAILEAFKETGIVIPFGQNDVTIRKMDWLREIIADYAAQGNAQHAGNGSRTFSQFLAK
jgi:small-conductance mechanosensitive channel